MRITRRHTMQGASPYKGVVFGVFPYSDPIEQSSGNDQAATKHALEFPVSWSEEARRYVAEHCFVHDGIAVSLAAITEEDVPRWLWRHVPDDLTAGETVGETSLRQVIDRLAGAWTYHGWSGGYFDREEDARTFFDEIRWLLIHQKISPNAALWRTNGVHWAYGLATGGPETFITDYRKGSVRRADAGDLPPHGPVINGTHGALTGEGGVWDLWEREGRILSQGSQCGANLSNVMRAPASQSCAGLPEILKLGEDAADLAAASLRPGRQVRRITIDASHPEADRTVRQPLHQIGMAEATGAGVAISLRHIQAIIDAAPAARPSKRRDNTALRFAIQSARQAQLPEGLIQRALTRIADAGPVTAHEILGTTIPQAAGTPAAAANTVTVFRLDDTAMAAASTGTGAPAGLIDAIARNGWMGIPSGLHFETPADTWNTCSASEAIRAASGDSSFLFLDDTASAPAVLNAPAFLDENGQLDVAGFSHAATLLTIALDISVMVSAQSTPRLAKRSWDFRPLSLSLTGIATVMMAQGLAYDSADGRAYCRALCGLLTGTGYLTSANLAGELGQFPAYAKNADAMSAVLKRHQEHFSSDNSSLFISELYSQVNVVWKKAIKRAVLDGLRNAQISLITSGDDEARITGCTAAGIAPLSSIIEWQLQAHGIYQKSIHPGVPTALRALRYSETQIDAMTRHVMGHGTLAGAPGVNHETLKKRGFTEAALRSVEAVLVTAFDITQVFNSAVLGEHYCIHMLGFAPEELQDPGFDMLAALGFSDAGIEAANLYCCGSDTLEGAPYLVPAHVAVFDCVKPQGHRGDRQVSPSGFLKMMAAAQPAVSGGIGHVLSLPATATIDDCKEAIFTAWRSGLKTLTFLRRIEETSDTAFEVQGTDTVTALRVVGTAQPSTATVRESDFQPEKERVVALESDFDIAVRDTGNDPVPDAEAPRRATSSLPTQSTASVTSSADAVVEQRQV